VVVACSVSFAGEPEIMVRVFRVWSGNSSVTSIFEAAVQLVRSTAVTGVFAAHQIRPAVTVFAFIAGRISRSAAPSKSCVTVWLVVGSGLSCPIGL
jgi:hypothetical protein